MSVNLSGVGYNHHSNVLFDDMSNVRNKQDETILEKRRHSSVENEVGKNIPSVYSNALQSKMKLTALEKKLMADLHDEKELFLKTSYPHSKKSLIASIKIINKLMLEPEINKLDLALLSKYIESFYHRIDTSGPYWKSENNIASRTLSKIGDYLAKTYNNFHGISNVPDKELSGLTSSWVGAMIEMTKNNSKGDNPTINYKSLNAILEYHVLNQEKLLSNYEFSVNTGKLLNLIYHIRPGSLDSQILSKSKDAIEGSLFRLVSQSLNIVNSKKNNFPLYHIRCALDVLSSIINSEKRNNPKSSFETQKNIDINLSNILKKYNSLPAKSDLREEINVVLTKYLEDTGRGSEKSNSSIFSVFLKPILEKEFIPHDFKLDSGYRIQSSYRFNNEEKNKLNIIATKVLKNFHESFGDKRVRDDNSKPLEIIVMKNKDHYHRYGNYPFRIDTNNGGVYIEGDSKNPNNQPRIFVYMKDNNIHNFGHEIVHYLDGKYNKYGDANMFPSEAVTWWSEGLAEYLSHGKKNEYAESVLMNCPPENRPSLRQIIDIDAFSANGHSERLYAWPYFVQKFLDSSPQLRSVRGELVRSLRQDTGSSGDNPSYSRVLNNFGQKYNEDFYYWLNQQSNHPTSINRYSTRR
ncbi:collagenase [Symbiopectobacterium purcellii]|uniref:collagenase n=1 Tax=Symbiopectobacterium purcellii TaxID=2871826 RepID=UPI003F871110